jgi:hypothetical protein
LPQKNNTPAASPPLLGQGSPAQGANQFDSPVKLPPSDTAMTTPNALVQAPIEPAKSVPRTRETSSQATPPVATPIKLATPPMVARAPADDSVQVTAPGSAQVESYDEEAYRCSANDTFRSISLAYYRTDKYERALQLFNRNHPLAADALKQDTPTLEPGLNVYIPPARILDKYFAAVPVSGKAPALPPSAPDTPAALQPSQPAPVTPGSSARERTYRVKNNGEMFREVARNTLGDPDRWADIYRLNPRFDPAEPIPSGTELRVPNQPNVNAQPSP